MQTIVSFNHQEDAGWSLPFLSREDGTVTQRSSLASSKEDKDISHRRPLRLGLGAVRPSGESNAYISPELNLLKKRLISKKNSKALAEQQHKRVKPLEDTEEDVEGSRYAVLSKHFGRKTNSNRTSEPSSTFYNKNGASPAAISHKTGQPPLSKKKLVRVKDENEQVEKNEFAEDSHEANLSFLANPELARSIPRISSLPKARTEEVVSNAAPSLSLSSEFNCSHADVDSASGQKNLIAKKRAVKIRYEYKEVVNTDGTVSVIRRKRTKMRSKQKNKRNNKENLMGLIHHLK